MAGAVVVCDEFDVWVNLLIQSPSGYIHISERNLAIAL